MNKLTYLFTCYDKKLRLEISIESRVKLYSVIIRADGSESYMINCKVVDSLPDTLLTRVLRQFINDNKTLVISILECGVHNDSMRSLLVTFQEAIDAV